MEIGYTVVATLAVLYTAAPLAKQAYWDLRYGRDEVSIHECGHVLAMAAAIHLEGYELSVGIQGRFIPSGSAQQNLQHDFCELPWVRPWMRQVVLAGYAAEEVAGRNPFGPISDPKRMAEAIKLSGGKFGTDINTWQRLAEFDVDRDKLPDLIVKEVLSERMMKEYLQVVEFMKENKDLLIEFASELDKKGSLNFEECLPFLRRVKFTSAVPVLSIPSDFQMDQLASMPTLKAVETGKVFRAT